MRLVSFTQGIPQSPPMLPQQPSGVSLSPRGSAALQHASQLDPSPFVLRQQQHHQQQHQQHQQLQHPGHQQHQPEQQQGAYQRHPSEPPPGHLFARPLAQEISSPSPPPAGIGGSSQQQTANGHVYHQHNSQQPQQRSQPQQQLYQQHDGGGPSGQQQGSAGHSPLLESLHPDSSTAMEEDELGDDVGLIDVEVFEMLLHGDE